MDLTFENLPGKLKAKPTVLDATTASNDEMARLRPERSFSLEPDKPQFQTSLEPHGVRFWSFELWK